MNVLTTLQWNCTRPPTLPRQSPIFTLYLTRKSNELPCIWVLLTSRLLTTYENQLPPPGEAAHDTYLGSHGGNRCVDTTVLLVLRPSPPLYIGIQFCGRRPAKSLLSLGPSPVQRGNESRLPQLAILVTDWLGTLWVSFAGRGEVTV